LLFTIILFAPESPWWLVRQGRFADAEESCRRLSSKDYYTPESGKRQVAYMIHTTAMERDESEGARFVDCFRGKINLRRTEIVRKVHFTLFSSWSGLGCSSLRHCHFDCLGDSLVFLLSPPPQVCAVFTIQWWCGDPLIAYAVTFYEEAGLDAIKAFDLNLGVTSMYIVGTLISWPRE
jgi:SP family general alpha glucoside:H+ symporter-like MFS transporter